MGYVEVGSRCAALVGKCGVITDTLPAYLRHPLFGFVDHTDARAKLNRKYRTKLGVW